MRLCLVLSFLAATGPGLAEIIDRVAVIVGDGVITESEISRQIRITAFRNREKPVFTPESRRAAADRLVEQALIRREIDVSRFATATTVEYDPIYREFRKITYPSDEAYKKALADYGLIDGDLQENFQWQATLLKFIDVRFRPGIQVPESELADYYKGKFVPEWTKNTAKAAPAYDEARTDIEKILASERTDNALDRWLGQTRTQTRIIYKEEAFR